MRRVLLIVMLSGSVEAGGAASISRLPPPFLGTAYPVVPPTRCPDLLGLQNRSVRTLQGPEYPVPFNPSPIYGYTHTTSPFQVASCWRGSLRGHTFTLTGYSNGEAITGVIVQYRGRTTRVILGSSGGPIVASFSGTSVCYLPNPAKGYPYVFDLSSPTRLSETPCINQFITRGVQEVYGLKRSYPLEYGVIRTYP